MNMYYLQNMEKHLHVSLVDPLSKLLGPQILKTAETKSKHRQSRLEALLEVLCAKRFSDLVAHLSYPWSLQNSAVQSTLYANKSESPGGEPGITLCYICPGDSDGQPTLRTPAVESHCSTQQSQATCSYLHLIKIK